MDALRSKPVQLLLAALVVTIGLAVLVGRFWHPAYGFTAFLQFDSTDAPIAIHEMTASPVFVYPGENGYDGFTYAEIAFHPLLDSTELKPALGNVPYRARRILNSALAWLLAGGQPDRIAHVYAALNLPVWLLLAWLSWRWLKVDDARTWWLWFGLMFSAGVLHSVRLALTDLLGVLLLGLAMGGARSPSALGLTVLRPERGQARPEVALHHRTSPRIALHPSWPLAILALGGLARETILIGVVGLWTGPWHSGRAWLRNGVRSLLVALPLGIWLLWVRYRAGAAPQGFGNFTWPVVGWLEKWRRSLAALGHQPQFFWVNLATVLAVLGLSLQAVYLLRRWRWSEAWWRVGMAGILMLLAFGTSVWEGNPGAAHRVLLPLGLAFAVLAARDRARWYWIVAGNLSVLSGVLALWTPPRDPAEIGAGYANGIRYVIRLGDGWYGAETAKGKLWSWTARGGELQLRRWPARSGEVALRLGLRALSPHRVELREGARLLWEGMITAKLQIVTVALSAGTGAVVVQVATPDAPVKESAAPDARELGLALYDPALVGS